MYKIIKMSNITIQDPKKASTFAFAALDKNFMQIGGCTPARARNELGSDQMPSPQIKPEATTFPYASALSISIFCHTNNIKLPTHISIAKLLPM
jgi:hypothetical protein